jgi:hypothetical protein
MGLRTDDVEAFKHGEDALLQIGVDALADESPRHRVDRLADAADIGSSCRPVIDDLLQVNALSLSCLGLHGRTARHAGPQGVRAGTG